MRLARISLRNFRCYNHEISIDIDDFTVLLGANDIGKSTILDAMAIFFEQDKIDQTDACVYSEEDDISITCEFDDLPDRIVVDVSNETSLEEEFLLNENSRLEIRKLYNRNVKSPKARIYVRAIHPSAAGVSDLLSLKRPGLQQRCAELDVDLTGVDQRMNASLRDAIRRNCDDLELKVQSINTDADGAKEIFPRVLEQLPSFFLFSVDRVSTDQDAEAQDPMKVVVRRAIDQEQLRLAEVAESVQDNIESLTAQILEKLRDIDQGMASRLVADFSPPRWDSLFKINLLDELAVPLNKRGSGVRRLVLLSFLQVQANSGHLETPERGIIYAIEEPETSQHPDRQRALLDALMQTAEEDGFQVVMTTHTPNLIRVLPLSGLRFIDSTIGARRVRSGSVPGVPELIRKALGVLPDHDVRMLVGVEGSHDIQFLYRISAILATSDSQIQPLEDLVIAGRVVLLPLGGSNLKEWPERLWPLRCREFYLFDRDYEPPAAPHYAAEAERINSQEKCEAVHTNKRSLENYLHPDAIAQVCSEAVLTSIADFDDVPAMVAEVVALSRGEDWANLNEKSAKSRKDRVKKWLNREAVSSMTPELLSLRDGLDELSGWFHTITRAATEELD